MYTNEILEEIRAIRERFAREADYDMGKYLDQLREYMDKHPHPGPVLRTPEEIERWRLTGELPAAAVREDEPKYGDKES